MNMPRHSGLFFRSHQKGQALLIVVLVMVVALTVGLSIASRSITTLRTSLEEANSQKAFSAAEAGVEQALKTGQQVVTAQSLGNNASITQVNITTLSGDALLPNNGNPIAKDDGVDVWLSTYPNYTNPLSGTVNVYWGNAANKCNDAALEIIVISGSSSAPSTTRYAVDPDSCSGRRASNHFSIPGNGTTVKGDTFNNSASFTITNGLILRIIPLYTSAPIGVTSSGFTFPSQGKLITSVGASGGTQRKIQFYQGYDAVPAEFFYSLFAL